KALENYAAYIFEKDLESEIEEDLLNKLKTHIAKASAALELVTYTSQESEKLFQALSDCKDQLSSLLIDHTEEKGWVESALGLFQQTKNLQEIKWKIKKYETLLLTLSQAL